MKSSFVGSQRWSHREESKVQRSDKNSFLKTNKTIDVLQELKKVSEKNGRC